jgi:alkanesulfonate monooxygenase SsuD/methylene tetrahydromethanopterin reductase-like flavin-dependent oxidoreductase (luciferase family)
VRNLRYNGGVELPRLAVRLRIDERGIGAAALGEIAACIESAGADALFVNGDREAEAANDPFVVLGAAAASTSRIGLGCLPARIEERHPSTLAKTLASLDLCCGGRAIACVALNFASGVDPAGVLVEAVAVLRAMLAGTAPSFHGEHFSITKAWNEPRMERDHPVPIGVAIGPLPTDDRAGAVQAAQVAVALTADVDFVVVEWHSEAVAPERGGIPALALVAASSIPAVGATVTSALRGGCTGVVLDFPEVPGPGAVLRALAVAEDANGPFTKASG